MARDLPPGFQIVGGAPDPTLASAAPVPQPAPAPLDAPPPPGFQVVDANPAPAPGPGPLSPAAAALTQQPTTFESLGHGADQVVSRLQQLYYMATGDDAGLARVTQQTNANNAVYNQALNQGAPAPGMDPMNMIPFGIGPAISAVQKYATSKGSDPMSAVGQAGMLSPLTLLGSGYLAASGGGGLAGLATYDPNPTVGGALRNTAFGAAAGPVVKLGVDTAVPLVAGGINAAVDAGKWLANKIGVDDSPEAVQAAVGQALQSQGIDFAALPEARQQQISTAAQQTVSAGQPLDPNALLNKADFDALGHPYLQGQITRDPRQFTAEVRASKIEGVGDPLQAVLQAQDTGLAGDIPKLRAQIQTDIPPGPGSDYAAATSWAKAVAAYDADARATASGTYDAARAAPGADLPFPNADQVMTKIGGVMDQVGSQMPLEVTQRLQQLQAGQRMAAGSIDTPGVPIENARPFTVGEGSDLWQLINTATTPGTKGAWGGAQIKAALADAAGQDSGQAGQAMGLFRDATQQWRGLEQNEELTPIAPLVPGPGGAVVEPANNFILNKVLRAQPQQLAQGLSLASQSHPNVVPDTQAAVLDWLQDQATFRNGAFNPGAFSDAMDTIGPNRMASLFPPEMTDTLETIRRAGLNTMPPPTSAINYSNTASELANLLQSKDTGPGLMGHLLSHIPMVGAPLAGAAEYAGNALANQAVRKAAGAAINAAPTTAQPFLAPSSVRAATAFGAAGLSPMVAALLAHHATGLWRGDNSQFPAPQQ